MSAEATAIHGITMKMLENAPTFADIYQKFSKLVGDKNLVIYNADYDIRLIKQKSRNLGRSKNKGNACFMRDEVIFDFCWRVVGLS